MCELRLAARAQRPALFRESNQSPPTIGLLLMMTSNSGSHQPLCLWMGKASHTFRVNVVAETFGQTLQWNNVSSPIVPSLVSSFCHANKTTNLKKGRRNHL